MAEMHEKSVKMENAVWPCNSASAVRCIFSSVVRSFPTLAESSSCSAQRADTLWPTLVVPHPASTGPDPSPAAALLRRCCNINYSKIKVYSPIHNSAVFFSLFYWPRNPLPSHIEQGNTIWKSGRGWAWGRGAGWNYVYMTCAVKVILKTKNLGEN